MDLSHLSSADKYFGSYFLNSSLLSLAALTYLYAAASALALFFAATLAAFLAAIFYSCYLIKASAFFSTALFFASLFGFGLTALGTSFFGFKNVGIFGLSP